MKADLADTVDVTVDATAGDDGTDTRQVAQADGSVARRAAGVRLGQA